MSPCHHVTAGWVLVGCSAVMIGLDGAGKSTVLERVKYLFKKDKGGRGSKDQQADKEKEILMALSKISPTVGLNIGRLEIRGANVIMWDLGGEEGLRGIWDKYYMDAHAVSAALAPAGLPAYGVSDLCSATDYVGGRQRGPREV